MQNIKYFQENNVVNKMQQVKLNKVLFKNKEIRLNNLISEIQNLELSALDVLIKLLAKHLNQSLIDENKKINGNVASGIHLLYIIQKIIGSLSRISDPFLKDQLKVFLNQLLKKAVLSLIRVDLGVLKVIVTHLKPVEAESARELDFIIKFIIEDSISVDTLILVFKDMLHHLQSCASKNASRQLKLNTAILKPIIKRSYKYVSSSLKTKNNTVNSDKYTKLTLENLESLYSSFNDLIIQLFNCESSKDVKLVFKWIYSVLYAHRGFYSAERLT
jgi:hypothetical protein